MNDPDAPRSLGLILWHQTWPMAIGVLSLLGFQLVDSAFIARPGTAPLAAQSFTFPHPADIRHEATYLLRAPFIHQLISNPADQAWQSFRYFPSAASALITSRLRLLGRIASLQPIALYLPANGATVNPNSLGYLSLADASLK